MSDDTDGSEMFIPPTCPDCDRAVGVDTGVTPDGECSYCQTDLRYRSKSVPVSVIEDVVKEFEDKHCLYAKQRLKEVIDEYD